MDCKSVGVRLRRFESCTCHPGQTWYLAMQAFANAKGKRQRSLTPSTRRDGAAARRSALAVLGYFQHQFGGGVQDYAVQLIARAARSAPAPTVVGVVASVPCVDVAACLPRLPDSLTTK